MENSQAACQRSKPHENNWSVILDCIASCRVVLLKQRNAILQERSGEASQLSLTQFSREPRGRVRLVVLCAGTQQIICVLTGVKRNGLPITNTSSCDSVGRLRRKTFPTRNLITIIKEQRHQSHRVDVLNSNYVQYHFARTITCPVFFQ